MKTPEPLPVPRRDRGTGMPGIRIPRCGGRRRPPRPARRSHREQARPARRPHRSQARPTRRSRRPATRPALRSRGRERPPGRREPARPAWRPHRSQARSPRRPHRQQARPPRQTAPTGDSTGSATGSTAAASRLPSPPTRPATAGRASRAAGLGGAVACPLRTPGPERGEAHPMQSITVDRDDRGIVTVTMNRPEKKNAIDAAMWDELLATFREVGESASDRVLVLTGADGAFWRRRRPDARRRGSPPPARQDALLRLGRARAARGAEADDREGERRRGRRPD